MFKLELVNHGNAEAWTTIARMTLDTLFKELLKTGIEDYSREMDIYWEVKQCRKLLNHCQQLKSEKVISLATKKDGEK